MLRFAAPALRRTSPATISPAYRSAIPARCIASSSSKGAQVQEDAIGNTAQDPPQNEPPINEPPKLGKRARKALKARQRQEQDRIAKDAKANARAEAREQESTAANKSDDDSSGRGLAPAEVKPILKVKHVLDAASGTSAARPVQSKELDQWRAKMKGQDGTDPTAGWSGSLFRSHISSLLSGFGTSPSTRPLQETDLPTSSTIDKSRPNSTSNTNINGDDREKASTRSQHKRGSSTPFMTKSERMESQARVIFQAIREARERGIVDEDESFFYPYPEGVPPKDVDGKDAVWLNLGPDPEAWGREVPQVKDKWLEVLSLGLAKEITGRPQAEETEVEAGEEEEVEQQSEFDHLVEDYDLEDHERLEQLGDSIVNMSSRLLAYLSYPDVNEGSLTRLSNYPTQNNFLALLFQECGLAARRDELRRELRAEHQQQDDTTTTNSMARREKRYSGASQTEEEKARLPLLIKRDADMFEAYAAAVFLSNGQDFNVVHEWLCHLFRPFQDQAYRFMVQRSEALARMQANRAAAASAASTAAATAAATAAIRRSDTPGSPTNLSADGLGIKSASVDPSSVPFSSLFPDFSRSEKTSPIPTYALTASEAFITDEFLTVAARARRQREERLREELRLQDQTELMNMGWFRKGFLNLRTGFRQNVLGKDVVREEEARLRQKINEQRGMSEKDRQRLRARERNAAGVSVRSTGSKKKKKVAEEEGQQD
ncbi:probable ribonuclease [Pseudozyma hubeiensis SY62]|uniref:Probable ribonuclease n=1 Tax=Pseudozyma hubeiensis (strain SY62) TaxID=1305764 RepID=R9P002_PSEHS|nr:probable ribonuclease [Pseudozyma hubeiensis SY62]GAC94503.1 probable ribonuclease [Pseudozyma hubeiensis SY62]